MYLKATLSLREGHLTIDDSIQITTSSNINIAGTMFLIRKDFCVRLFPEGSVTPANAQDIANIKSGIQELAKPRNWRCSQHQRFVIAWNPQVYRDDLTAMNAAMNAGDLEREVVQNAVNSVATRTGDLDPIAAAFPDQMVRQAASFIPIQIGASRADVAPLPHDTVQQGTPPEDIISAWGTYRTTLAVIILPMPHPDLNYAAKECRARIEEFALAKNWRHQEIARLLIAWDPAAHQNVENAVESATDLIPQDVLNLVNFQLKPPKPV